MTEVDDFFERSALRAEEPIPALVSGRAVCLVNGELLSDETAFFDEDYADEAAIFSPKTRKEAVSRLKLAEEQFANGQWHTLTEVLKTVRHQIVQNGNQGL